MFQAPSEPALYCFLTPAFFGRNIYACGHLEGVQGLVPQSAALATFLQCII